MISVIISSKIKTEWESTENISMKLSDTRVNCVLKNERKASVKCQNIEVHEGEDIPAISAIKKVTSYVIKIPQRSSP